MKAQLKQLSSTLILTDSILHYWFNTEVKAVNIDMTTKRRRRRQPRFMSVQFLPGRFVVSLPPVGETQDVELSVSDFAYYKNVTFLHPRKNMCTTCLRKWSARSQTLLKWSSAILTSINLLASTYTAPLYLYRTLILIPHPCTSTAWRDF